jgi:hypothetical protein
MSFTKWEKLVIQDLLLLVVGIVFLVISISGVLGLNGFLTLMLGCGFMGFSVYDFFKLVNKEPLLQ